MMDANYVILKISSRALLPQILMLPSRLQVDANVQVFGIPLGLIGDSKINIAFFLDAQPRENSERVVYRKGNLFLLLLLVPFLLISLFHPAQKCHSQQKESLNEIYRGGKIKFKPVIVISQDTLNKDVPTKVLNSLYQGKDRIFITDSSISNVKMLTKEGKVIKTFGTKGKGPGDLYYPSLVASSKNRLVIWEIGNKRFSFFTLDGMYIKSVKPRLKGFLTDMRCLDDGRFILEVQRVEANAKKKEIKDLHFLELYSSDMEYVKTLHCQNTKIFKYINNSNLPRIPLPFSSRLLWDVLPGNKLVLGYSVKYELKMIDVDTGKVKRITREYTPKEVTEAEKKLYLEMRLNNENKKYKLSRHVKRLWMRNIEFPEFKPAFDKIHVDQEGHILVFTLAPLTRKGGRSIAKQFEVFDSNGNFLRRVMIESEKEMKFSAFIPVSSNEFWCREALPSDGYEQRYVKYKME